MRVNPDIENIQRSLQDQMLERGGTFPTHDNNPKYSPKYSYRLLASARIEVGVRAS